MSALWAVADVIKATGGTCPNDWCAWRVEIDSRKVQPGDLFVAIIGERVDGHDYVADAFARGAIAAIVSHPLASGGNQLLVPDTMKALEDLGKYNRARSGAKIIGITGSVGKTSTKEMLRLALSAHGKAYATGGNYNNHIGVPITLANMPLDTDFAVIETGMNHAGEIRHLTKMVRPDIALVTCVESVHQEFFDSIEEIAAAKAEIFEGLSAEGMAIINADQKYFSDIKYKTITFGVNEKADCRLLSYLPTATGCDIVAEVSGQKLSYCLAATGKHFAMTSVSVFAVAVALGLDVAKTAAALAVFSEPEGRGRAEKISFAGKEILLIDDSYNASPASMRSAFAKIFDIYKLQGGGRKIALLGDMLELGAESAKLHAGLVENLQKQGFDKVYTAGKLMKNLFDALPAVMRGAHAEKSSDLPGLVEFKDGDIVLVKGSHGSKIYEVANLLKQEK